MDTNDPIVRQMLKPLYQHLAHLLGYDWPMLTSREIDTFMVGAAMRQAKT